MEVSINVGYPIAGWFMMENPSWRWMMTRGTPVTQETPSYSHDWYANATWAARYCLLCMVRFFTSFSAQPRLAVVTTTLEAPRSRLGIQKPKWVLYDIIWYYMILYDIIWYYKILYDIIWYYVILYDIIWYYIDIIWYDIILYDIFWYYMILYDIIWYYMILLYMTIQSL